MDEALSARNRRMEILVADIGGTYIKIRSTLSDGVSVFESGPKLTPQRMVDHVLEAAAQWPCDAVSLGYPGVVRDGRPAREPHNLAAGWVGFDYHGALRRPVRIINDAAMQAIGSFEGGRMLFLGLGTGLGSAMVIHGAVQPLELSQLPYKEGGSFGDFLGRRGLERMGFEAWHREVFEVTSMMREALVADYVVLGGGNVRYLSALPEFTRPGSNGNAFDGGVRLWRDPDVRV